jgi:hypothetical protein
MAAVIATTSSSIWRTEGKTSACMGLVCEYEAYTSFSRRQCSCPIRYSVPDTLLDPSSNATSLLPCARTKVNHSGGIRQVV